MTKNRERHAVTIELIWEDSVSCNKVMRKSFSVSLKREDYLRDIALSKIGDLDNLYLSDNDRAIVIRLKNDGTKNGEDFGIQYCVNKHGQLRRLKGCEPTQYNWSYGEILRLRELGVINGDVEHVIVEFPNGLGAAGGSGLYQFNELLDFAKYIASIVGGGFKLVRYIKIKNTIKRIRKNGFDNPKDIRDVIEKRDNWALKTIKKMLQMDTVSAAAILMNLGYVERGDYWIYDGHDANSLRMRAEWLENEKQYDEKIKEKAEEYNT